MDHLLNIYITIPVTLSSGVSEYGRWMNEYITVIDDVRKSLVEESRVCYKQMTVFNVVLHDVYGVLN